MSIADIFKRWLGLSDKKPQTTPPARPAPARPQPVKNAPPSARDAAENREAQQRAAVNSSNNIGQLIQKHRMSGAAGRKAIEQRLGELLVVNTADKDFFRKQDIDQLQALALFGASPEIREQALERIEDQNVLAQIVSENSSSRIRQLAAAKITDESLLNFAGEAIRHKDKGLYKQIRHRLDSTHAESKAREDRQKLLEKLCHDMEVQSRQAVSPLYAAKLLNLEQQWKEASSHPDANLSPALQQRFEAATQSARFALAESTRASEAEITARQEQQDVTEALHQRLEALTAASDWVGHAVFLQALSQLEGRWGITLTAASPDNGLRHRFEALQKEARQLHRLLEQAEPAVAEIQALLNPSEGDAPDAGGLSRLHELLKPLSLNRHGRIPLLLKQAQSLVEQAQLHASKKKTSARVEKARKPPKETPPELLDMLERLAAMVQEGHVLDAEKLLKEALALAKGQKIKNARLNELADEVYKLKDWAKFAILPKKEAMVARMTTLAEEALSDPEARMEAIKSLQAEWNALGKMNTEAERQLWKQFQDLGQKAWEPVKQFLDEQRAREDANAARREALCAELEEYQANMPADVNWQRHITILRTAREEWQRHHPVSSKVHKALQARFSSVINALEARLHTEYEHQESRKKALIAQAAELLDAEDIRAACESAKSLQQAWKETGSCGHARDQKLWEEFRQHCDAIFARREEAKVKQKNEEQDLVDQAGQLLDQIEAVMATDDSADLAQSLIEAFESLTLVVARESQTALRNRLADIRQRLQVQQQALRQADFRADVNQLAECMNLCLAVEQALIAGQPSDDAQAGWNPDNLPPSFAEELLKRWEHLPRTLELEPSQQSGLFSQHCLLLEILLDLPSPAEEQDLRVSRQMALFKLQRYPKTIEEKRKLVRNTLHAAIICPALQVEDSAHAMERFERIIRSEAFLSLF